MPWEPPSIGSPSAPDEPVAADFVPDVTDDQYRAWPPTAPAPTTAASRRRTALLVVGALAGAATLALGCGSVLVQGIRSLDPRPAPTEEPMMVLPTVSPFGGVYAVPNQLCERVDLSAMRPQFTTLSNVVDAREVDAATGATLVSCAGRTDKVDGQGEFRLVVAVFADETAARATFAAARPDDARELGEGLGAASYVYEDDGARVVRTTDANLTMTMSWRRIGEPEYPPGLTGTLVSVCRMTLRSLR